MYLRKAAVSCSAVKAETRLRRFVELQRAVEALPGGEETDQIAVIGASDHALLQQPFLAAA